MRDHLLWGGADGFFVEFGARDGITHSNTAYFERTLGWKGLCIEPLAVEFKALRVNTGQTAVASMAPSARAAGFRTL